jgi:adenylate kinase family enzyme
MRYRLIMLVGSSPGAGKSTLSEFLYQQLTCHAIPTQWIYEDDVLHLPAFAQFIQDFQSGHPNAIDSLLAATATFVDDAIAHGTVPITDSIFPCINWFFAANSPRERIAELSSRLDQLLSPLQPLIIYLDSDIETAFKRAVAQRGAAWLDSGIANMNTWTYHQDRPVYDIQGVIAYWTQAHQLTRQLLDRWSCDMLVLDSTYTPVDELKARVLAQLALAACETEDTQAIDTVQSYIGTYMPRDTPASDTLIQITLAEEQLWINRYWPSGCRLVYERAATYRLQGTSQHIEFGSAGDHMPSWLVYRYGNQEEWFDRTAYSAEQSG